MKLKKYIQYKREKIEHYKFEKTALQNTDNYLNNI